MNYLLIPILLFASMWLTVTRSAVTAFVSLYLPMLLLLYSAYKIPLPGLPDLTSTIAVAYGIMGGLVIKGGEPLPFRWSVVDVLFLASQFSIAITAGVTEIFYTSVNAFGEQLLGYVFPYFLARVMFSDPVARRTALKVLCYSSIFIAVISLIECRLWPYFYARSLRPLGLNTAPATEVLYRFLFRAQASMVHPIDLGVSGYLMAAMIVLLAATTGVGLRNSLVRCGIGGALVASLASQSFSAYLGVVAAFGLVGAIYYFPGTARLMPFVVAGMIYVGYQQMDTMRGIDIATERNYERDKGTVRDSYLVRAMIVQNSWPFIQTAGPFGFGKMLRKDQLSLDSVDNSYILFTLRYGYVYITLFLMLPITLAVRLTIALGYARSPRQRLPLAVAVGSVVGVMVSMFTVWFGFVYSVLWVIMLALASSVIDTLVGKAVAVRSTPQSAPPAYPSFPTPQTL